MDDLSNGDRAIDLLQQLGLKEYEAKCFVALTRLPRGTAKEISEVSDVPRTRVYDAVRVLETKGLVEVQHTSPQQFRAVSVDEAADVLRAEYETRTDSLRAALRGVGSTSADDDESPHEVWALSGGAAVATRARQAVEEATEEVVLVVGVEELFDPALAEALSDARDRGVTIVVGTVSEAIRDRVAAAVPRAQVFVSGLDWLRATDGTRDDTEIGRLLLVDRDTILMSSMDARGDVHEERAVFGTGFSNGLVVIVRRLMATGLIPRDDPGSGTEA